MRIFKIVAAAALAITTQSPADATVITFDDNAGLQINVGQTVTFTERGYDFTFTSDPLWGSFALIDELSPGRCVPVNCAWNGTNTFNSFNQAGLLTLRKSGGGLFSVTAFDTARLLPGGIHPFHLSLTAMTLDGPISFSFIKPQNANGFSTYGLDLTNISSLTFANRPEDYAPSFALDNIVIDDGIVAVPEPASWALLILGFAFVGRAMRRPKPLATAIAFKGRSRARCASLS